MHRLAEQVALEVSALVDHALAAPRSDDQPRQEGALGVAGLDLGRCDHLGAAVLGRRQLDPRPGGKEREQPQRRPEVLAAHRVPLRRLELERVLDPARDRPAGQPPQQVLVVDALRAQRQQLADEAKHG